MAESQSSQPNLVACSTNEPRLLSQSLEIRIERSPDESKNPVFFTRSLNVSLAELERSLMIGGMEERKS